MMVLIQEIVDITMRWLSVIHLEYNVGFWSEVIFSKSFLKKHFSMNHSFLKYILFFQGSFRITAKLNRKHKEFPYTRVPTHAQPCPRYHPASRLQRLLQSSDLNWDLITMISLAIVTSVNDNFFKAFIKNGYFIKCCFSISWVGMMFFFDLLLVWIDLLIVLCPCLLDMKLLCHHDFFH